MWVDPLTIKVREAGRTVNVHALIAIGVDGDGQREVLRAAGAQDPSLAGMWQQDTDPRLEVHTAAARSLVTKAGARAGPHPP